MNLLPHKYLTKDDINKLLQLDLSKIDCQKIFLLLTKIPIKGFHYELIKKINKIVPIYCNEVKMYLEANPNTNYLNEYMSLFKFKKETKDKMLEPVFEDLKYKKRRNDEKKKIRRDNNKMASENIKKVVEKKVEYKRKIEDIYKKIRSQK